MTPTKRYPCILADPPWAFRNGGTRAAPQYEGKQRKASHYQTMKLTTLLVEVAVMVRQLSADDCFLFLWAPNSLVIDGTATAVARAWGFEPKQLIPWIKMTKDGFRPALGMGNYSRVCSEMMVLARRGRPKVCNRAVPGVIFAPRTRHSAKPDESYDLIERLCKGPRIELFARREMPGWKAWGDQLDESP